MNKEASAARAKEGPSLTRKSARSRESPSQAKALAVTRPARQPMEKSAWNSIVRSIALTSSRSPQRILFARLTVPSPTHASEDMDPRRAKVNLLERTSTRTAIISWHDPTRCSYRFQLWRRVNAIRSGVCALSGTAINVGNSIYKPDAQPPPLNASAMILATEVESRLDCESFEDC